MPHATLFGAADVQALVRKTVEKFGRVDVAFNNAGIEGNWIPITEQSEEDWDQTIDINLKGTWLCLKGPGPVADLSRNDGRRP